MKMNEIIALAKTLLGLEQPNSEADCARRDADLLTAANLIVNELAAEYLPLEKTETIAAENGKISFAALSENATEVRSVRRAGEEQEAAYRQYPAYLALAAGKYDVTYRYLPREKSGEETCDYAERQLPRRVIAYGVAAEFCMMRGLFAECRLWDKRYKDSLVGYCRPRRIQIRRMYFI